MGRTSGCFAVSVFSDFHSCAFVSIRGWHQREPRREVMKTVLDVITATTDYFRNSGIENPRLNIEHLLAHVMGKRRMDLYLEFDRPLGEKELAPLRDLVRRRAQREPLQHLLGTVEFLGLTLKSDARADSPPGDGAALRDPRRAGRRAGVSLERREDCGCRHGQRMHRARARRETAGRAGDRPRRIG